MYLNFSEINLNQRGLCGLFTSDVELCLLCKKIKLFGLQLKKSLLFLVNASFCSTHLKGNWPRSLPLFFWCNIKCAKTPQSHSKN